MKPHRTLLALALTSCALGLAACGEEEETGAGASGGGQEQQAEVNQDLSGSIAIDGSSTVQPFAEAAAELFQEQAPNVKVTVGGAGTGDGFERFCAGEIQISNASRAIEEDEIASCEKGKVEYEEVQVANDGIAVVSNPQTQVECFTTDQLKKLLAPKSKITNLQDLGGDLPAQEVQFFTPGEESGTFDFFTETVLETDAEQRTDDVQTSANDNQIVTGIEGTEGAIGYIGFSFAEEAGERLNIAQIDGGDGCVAPSKETIQNGEYKPLARPLFMYPSKQALAKPEVKAFMDFVTKEQQRIAEAAKIVPLTEAQATEAQQKVAG